MEEYRYNTQKLGTLNYKDYRRVIDELLAQNKTSGEDHSPFMVSYTRKNVERMQALEENVEIFNTLKDQVHQLKSNYIFLVLTEAWCGDAAQIIPVLDKIADASEGKIELQLIWRDENPEIMQKHLTQGGKSIPKLILIDKENLQAISDWGPRPEVLQELANEWKNEADYTLKSWAEKLHIWYAENKTSEIQEEISELLRGL